MWRTAMAGGMPAIAAGRGDRQPPGAGAGGGGESARVSGERFDRLGVRQLDGATPPQVGSLAACEAAGTGQGPPAAPRESGPLARAAAGRADARSTDDW